MTDLVVGLFQKRNISETKKIIWTAAMIVADRDEYARTEQIKHKESY